MGVVFRRGKVLFFLTEKIKYPVHIRIKYKNKWKIDKKYYNNLGKAIKSIKKHKYQVINIASSDGSIYYSNNKKSIMLALPLEKSEYKGY